MGRKALRYCYPDCPKERRLITSRRRATLVKKALEFGVNGNEVLLLTRDLATGKITVASNLQENLQVLRFFAQSTINEYAIGDGHVYYNPQLCPKIVSSAEIANTQTLMNEFVNDTNPDSVTLGATGLPPEDPTTGTRSLFLDDKRFDGFVQSTEKKFQPVRQKRMVFANSPVGATTIVTEESLQAGINDINNFYTLEQRPNYTKKPKGRKRHRDPSAFPDTFPKRFKSMIVPDTIEVHRSVEQISDIRPVANDFQPGTPLDRTEHMYHPDLPATPFPDIMSHPEKAYKLHQDPDLYLLAQMLGEEFQNSDEFEVVPEKSSFVIESKTVKFSNTELQQSFAAFSLKKSFSLFMNRKPVPPAPQVTVATVESSNASESISLDFAS